ncbi:MAG: hypothetical protein U0172_03955 [Nitrospiraceae bacterium]
MPSRLSALLTQTIARWRTPFAHAFAVAPSDAPLSAEDLALLERLAESVVRRGLTAPATVFLESVGPLNFLGSQVMYGLAPLLNCACDSLEFDRAARLLERRETLERLVAMIETRAAQGDASKAATT